MKSKIFAIALSAVVALPSFAASDSKEAKTDSIAKSKEVENRNVMLNASADNQPRQISIGLPSSLSASIYEDGLPVSYNVWPCLPFMYWTGTASHGRMGLQSLGESAITNGAVNYAVMSNTREGGDKFEGHVNYTTNIFNLQRFDVNVAGPIAKNWYYTAGVYANLDPSSNKPADCQYANDMKIIKFGITHRFNNGRGKASLIYRYAYTKNMGDSYGPFIYVGDGSVKEYPGFNLGRDSFLPANGLIHYTDVMTGEEKEFNRVAGTHALNNGITFKLNYDLGDKLMLDVRSKYNYSNAAYSTLALAGIGEAVAGGGFTYAYDANGHKAGEEYVGKYNNRFLLRDFGFERDWLTTVELKRASEKHNWRIGANFFWNRQGIQANTGIYAHTVEANPAWLAVGGTQGIARNTGGEFYDTHETKTALYLSDDWNVTDRLFLSAGARVEYYSLGGTSALAYLNATDKDATNPQNIRVPGFNVKNGKLTDFSKSWVTPAATVNGRFTISRGFGLVGEYVFAVQHPNSQDFAGPYAPIMDAVNINLGRFGIFYNTKWMKLVSQVSTISQTNYKSRTQFTNPNNANDVVTLPITNDVQTFGWTTDVVLTPFKGFMFHGLLTLQNPKYKNFTMKPTFEDGTSQEYNFSDNITTGVSKTIIELDPSYSFSKFRIWASFRYQSKQYINKTNTLFFNGRWETFAGVNYTVNKNLSLSCNFVNLLNEKGASGSIGSADLVTDVTPYQNYTMAGSYIRPFTVEFAAHLNF